MLNVRCCTVRPAPLVGLSPYSQVVVPPSVPETSWRLSLMVSWPKVVEAPASHSQRANASPFGKDWLTVRSKGSGGAFARKRSGVQLADEGMGFGPKAIHW